MAKIISVLLISFIGYKVANYDFFIIATPTSFSIDIYKEIRKMYKRYSKYTKDKTARR